MPNPPRSRSRRAFLTAGLGALLLNACGGGNPSPAGIPTPTAGPGGILGIIPRPAPTPTPLPEKVRFAHWLQDVAAPVMQGLVRGYNDKHPDVIVQEEVAPFGDHRSALLKGLAAGSAPDVFLISGPDLAVPTATPAILDLTTYLSRDKLDLTRYWSSPQTRQIGGKQFAVPLWCAVDLAYLNHDLLAKAKLGSPAADWTWDDLLKAASQLTVGKPGEVSQWGLLVVNDIQGGWGGFVASNDGHWIDPTTGQAALDANAIAALQWVVDAINRHHVAPGPRNQDALTRGGTIDPFLAGKVAILVNGTWEMPSLLGNAAFPWDILPLPKAPKTAASQSVADAQPGSIARATKAADASWGFLSFLIDESSQRQWARIKVRLPSLVSVAADATDGYAVSPPTRAPAASDALTTARDLEFVPNWQAFRAALTVGLQPAYDGDQPLSEAVPAAVKAANQALGPVATPTRAPSPP
ncbi:MAG TPA: extracellular solute-binding protein [Chloroflexota bacterium]|nr:extracellular solute-binding protein [Chloroflexota bacterium]